MASCSKKTDYVSRDIIKDLPNPLISHILSFLPTKEAAATSVLSSKWRFLFASVTNFDFDDANEETPTSFVEFVDRVFALQTVHGNATLDKFSLSCGDGVDPTCVTRRMVNVLACGVSDLDLDVSPLEHFPAMLYLLKSKSLVKLRLGPRGFFTSDLEGGDVFLPKLKCLYLDSIFFEEGDVGFTKLLSGCPVLEELVLINLDWDFWESCSVSSTTLKRLTFFCDNMDENPQHVSFDTPNLVYLAYSDTIAEVYPKIHFDSLIESHIGLRLTEDQSTDARLLKGAEDNYLAGLGKKLLVGICNVHILFLTAEARKVLTLCWEANIPVFKNLIQLTIESNPEIGWEALPRLLNNCPKLETLVIKGLGHKYNNGCGNVCCCDRLENVPSCLSSSPVKVLKIFSMFGHIDGNSGMDIDQIKHFLEKMLCLEQLIVSYNTVYEFAVYVSFKRLEKISRIASPKCKIQVICGNLCLTSTLPSSLSKK